MCRRSLAVAIVLLITAPLLLADEVKGRFRIGQAGAGYRRVVTHGTRSGSVRSARPNIRIPTFANSGRSHRHHHHIHRGHRHGHHHHRSLGFSSFAFGTGIPFVSYSPSPVCITDYFASPYQYYGPVYSSSGFGTALTVASPVGLEHYAWQNPVLREALLENAQRWKDPIDLDAVPKKAKWVPKPSSKEGMLRSLHAEAQGDNWFKQQNYSQAYLRYKRAVKDAADRSEPRHRLALTLAVLGRYERAIGEFKRLLQVDSAWPSVGERWETLFGEDNRIARNSTILKMAEWVREDIRDPDRLFLMGVMLHFNEDDRAAPFFETAWRLSGGGEHLVAFLEPAEPVLPADVEDADNRDPAIEPPPLPAP